MLITNEPIFFIENLIQLAAISWKVSQQKTTVYNAATEKNATENTYYVKHPT